MQVNVKVPLGGNVEMIALYIFPPKSFEGQLLQNVSLEKVFSANFVEIRLNFPAKKS